MRGAIRILAAGICLSAPVQPARGETTRERAPGTGPASASPAIAGPIAKARKLIAAGKRAEALPVLEDALLDLPEPERRTAIDLLRESYKLLAREAEASGKRREAGSYRDNLAILDRVSQGTARSASPPMSIPPLARAGPASTSAPPPGAVPEAVRAEQSGPMPAAERSAEAMPASRVGEKGPRDEPPVLKAPAVLPEPDRMPPPPRQAVNAPISMAGPPAGGASVDAGEDPAASINPASGTPDEAQAAPPATTPSIGEKPALVTDAAPTPAPGPIAAPATAAPLAVPDAQPMKVTELDRANQLFRSRRYGDAGRLYAALASEKRLPADRRPHWAYCRAYEVVRRINAHPRSRREWDAIDAEIQSIQRLTPGNWFGEYLRNHVAEARRLRRWPADRSGKLVVRGAEPEEPGGPPSSATTPPPIQRSAPGGNDPPNGAVPASAPTGPGPGRPFELPSPASAPIDRPALEVEGPSLRERGSPATGQTDNGAFAAAPVEGAEAAPVGSVDWHVQETANFRIFHCDPVLARRVGEVAESVRAAQARRWGSPAAHVRWSPRCEVYLYPGPKIYARETGQPEMSPGISTMSNDHVRVTSRRVNLRADNPLLLSATLPHEVAHIVLADLFIARIIPRWADEGIAVLAEPPAEQRHRVADLRGPLESGRVFNVGRLMTMDYPDARDSRLFYAESVSLTRYLMTLGPPDRLIRFLHDSQRIGADAALKDVYRIEGTTDLQNRWLAHAQKESETALASSRDDRNAKAQTVR